jgi:hypothetical protein
MPDISPQLGYLNTAILADTAGSILPVGNNVIRVYRVHLATIQGGTSIITFKDGNRNLSGPIVLQNAQAMVLKNSGEPWFRTSPGNAFHISVSGDPVAGEIYYVPANPTVDEIAQSTPAGDGSRVLLNTLIANKSQTLQDTTSFTNAYVSYEIEFENIQPTADAVNFSMLVHANGAFPNSGYLNSCFETNSGSTSLGASGTTSILLTHTSLTLRSAGNIGFSGIIRILRPTGSNLHYIYGKAIYIGGASSFLTNCFISGVYNTAGPIDGFQVSMSSGTINKGTIRVYGYPT